MTHTEQAPERLSSEHARRAGAVLRLLGHNWAGAAAAVGYHPAHLREALLGKRKLSPELASRLRALLGDEGWRFMLGEVPTIADPGRKVAA